MICVKINLSFGHGPATHLVRPRHGFPFPLQTGSQVSHINSKIYSVKNKIRTKQSKQKFTDKLLFLKDPAFHFGEVNSKGLAFRIVQGCFSVTHIY